MRNDRLSEGIKAYMDRYMAGELSGEELRIFRNMLAILGDDVQYTMEQQKKKEQERMDHALAR